MSLISVHKVTIEIDRDKFPNKEVFREFSENVSRQVHRTLLERTQRGEYLSGSSPGHETYSPAYAAMKGKPLSPVTLRDTGQMMASLETVVQNRGVMRNFAGVEISDSEAGRKAAIHNDIGAHGVRRRWFDVTQDEVRDILRDAAAETSNFSLEVF